MNSNEHSSGDEPTGEILPFDPQTNENKGLKRTSKTKGKSSKTNEGKGISSLNSFYFPGKKTFDDWSKFQLVTALVRDGQVIRDENYISVSVLKSFAEAVFMDRDIPQKPIPYSLEEQTVRHTAALTIQNSYFTWMITALQNEGGGHGPSHGMHDDILAAMHSGDAYGGVAQPTLPTQNSFKRQATVDDNDPYQSNSMAEREHSEIDRGLQGDLAIQRQMEDDDDTSAVQNSILEEEFIPPSLEYASLYADYNHPRLGGLGGKVMPWLRTSTGASLSSLSPPRSVCLSVCSLYLLSFCRHGFIPSICLHSFITCVS